MLSSLIRRRSVLDNLGIQRATASLRCTVSRSFWWDNSDNNEKGIKEKLLKEQKKQKVNSKEPLANLDQAVSDKAESDIANSNSSTIGSNSIDSSSKSIVPVHGDNAHPKVSPLIAIPLLRRPVFPGFIAAVNLTDKATIDAIANSQESGMGYLGCFFRTDGATNESSKYDIIENPGQVHKVGVFGKIVNSVTIGQSTQLMLMAHRRITLEEFVSAGPPAMVRVTHWKKNKNFDITSPILKAYKNEVFSTVRELFKINPLAQDTIYQLISQMDNSDPMKLADCAAALTTADGIQLQKVLESDDVEERLALALELLRKEIEITKLQKEISQQVEEKVSKQQREYFLREQLKNIKQELGMNKDDKEDLIAKYMERLSAIKALPSVHQDVVRAIEDEVKRLHDIEKSSPEFNIIRSYLDTLTSLPWGVKTEDMVNLQKAKEVLDEDHYGLDEIKKRVLEYMAVGKLKGSVVGKIICFIGPPGVGKTSIAKSISTVLGRKFYRFSVGGLTDIAEVKGHRRTYIGAMPGKPILALKSSGSSNPVILIDEIDKLGRGYSGDPASALLELLDPSQNHSFVDHYLDVPVDFSNVLFVCTANDESAIPGPLRDRMEIIRLSGYDIPEKVAIASKYLVPKALKESGLSRAVARQTQADNSSPAEPKTDSNTTNQATAAEEAVGREQIEVDMTDAALEALVRSYCRESGVRSLEKHIEKIVRKIALEFVTSTELRGAPPSTTTQAAAEEVKPEVSEVTAEQQSFSIDNSSDSSSSSSNSSSNSSGEQVGTQTVVVTEANLEHYIGKPKYQQDALYDTKKGMMPPGIVMGLAWNPMGGSPVFIETAAIPIATTEAGGGVNMITGQLGAVMKESVSIAYTFSRKFLLEKVDPANNFFKSNQIHLHVPEGSVEKDGPSAGIAMATSLISLSTATSVRPRLAMTGELSLTGKVLPVGGIKEKTLAARRSGADTVILPAANKRDFEELPTYVKDCVKVHFVEEYSEVYKLALDQSES